MIPFAIVGAGWRSEFFLRIAQQLPDLFQVTGMVIRDPEKGRDFEQTWGIRSFRTVEELVANADFSFVIVSVPRTVAPDITLQLATSGIPVLCETPPAMDVQGLVELNEALSPSRKVQIAEQYAFQPNHAARIKLASSDRLGSISQAQVSVAHDYHGISLLRHYLGIRFEDAVIHAYDFESPLVASPTRNGAPGEDGLVTSRQVIATLRFGDKLAVYDFTDDQYFSWVRSPRTLVRGEKGEINNFEVKYLHDYRTPIEATLRRTYAGHDGNLEGFYLKDVLLGDETLYRNPFIPGRLTDDEIAIATCLQKMHDYAQGGPSFYSVAEASQDHYLALMIHQAVASRQTLATTQQPWARLERSR